MQVKWLNFEGEANPLARFNPMRPLVLWYNKRRMNKYVSRKIDSRFAKLQSEGVHSKKGNKSIIDLVLTAYMSENVARDPQVLDKTFKIFTMN